MCRLHKLNFRQAKKAGFEFVSKSLFVYNRDVVRFVDYGDEDYVTTHLWVRGFGRKAHRKTDSLK